MLSANLIKIIEFLIRNIPNRFNTNQLSRELKISVGSSYNILKSLEKKNILASQKIGNGIYYKLNLDNREAQSISELVLMESRNKAAAKNPYASIYANDIKDAEKISKAAILFGSILKTKDVNDVDALFIIDSGKTKAVEDFCMKLSNLRPKRVNPLLMTAHDFKNNISKRDRIITDILKKGMILFGEDVILNAMRDI